MVLSVSLITIAKQAGNSAEQQTFLVTLQPNEQIFCEIDEKTRLTPVLFWEYARNREA
jgi:hypothetical protein